jgi:hypothetical protein
MLCSSLSLFCSCCDQLAAEMDIRSDSTGRIMYAVNTHARTYVLYVLYVLC